MTQDIQLSPKQKTLKEASENLQALLDQQIKAMPKGFNQTRFLQNCITVLQDTKEIEKCTPMSIARCMIKGAYLGLDFFRRECYGIPYEKYENRRPTGTYELNFQTDYKGEIKLCNKYSTKPVQDIYAKLVREGDELEVRIEAGKQIVNFTPKQFNDGAIVGAFAIVYFENGAMLYEAMSLKELEETRKNYSKVPDSPAYAKSIGEMYKKIVLRRLCKLIDLDFETAEQDTAFEEGAITEVKENKKLPVKIDDPFKPELKSIEEAQIVDPDAELKATLRKKWPSYEEWQIDALVKESKEQ